MSAAVTFDASAAGSWRGTLDPEGAACAVCRQRVCGHSDLEYAGLVPAAASREVTSVHAAENGRG